MDDGTLHLVTLPDGKPVCVATGAAGWIDDLEFSPDSKELAAIGLNFPMRIYSCADGKVLAEIAPHVTDHVTSRNERTVDYLDGGASLLISGWSPVACLVERRSGKVLREITLAPADEPDSAAPRSAACVSEDRSRFALADEAGRLAICSAKTGEFLAGPVSLAPLRGNSLAFDGLGKRLAVGASDCKVRVYELPSLEKPRELSHCDENLFGDLEISSVRFSADGKTLLSASYTFWEVRLWDLETGKQRWAHDYGGGNPTMIQARFTPDGAHVIVSKGGVRLDGKLGTPLAPLGREQRTDFGIGGRYAWCAHGSKLEVYDVSADKLVCELPLAAPAPR